MLNYGAIATGNRPILIRCALQHARAAGRYDFALDFGEFERMCRGGRSLSAPTFALEGVRQTEI